MSMQETQLFTRAVVLRNSKKILDYFFVMRPILFIPGWTTLLAGVAVGRNLSLADFNFKAFQISDNYFGLLTALIAFSLAMGGSFILNQLCDVDTDRNNKKLFYFGSGYLSPKEGLLEALFLIIFAPLMGILINEWFASLIVLFVLVTGYFYNYGPFILKNRPVGGLLANMAMGWLAFLMGMAIREPLSPETLMLSVPYVFFNTSLYLLTTLPDVKGDFASNKITFPVKFGARITIAWSGGLFLLALLSALIFRDYFLLAVLVSSLPFFTYLIFRKSTSAAIMTVKMGITMFSLLICLWFPWYVLLLAFLFAGTRIYYKYRFNFDYPNFRAR